MKKILSILLFCLVLIHPALADTPRIGVISAMDNEVDLLLKAAAIDRVDTIGGIDFNVGTLCDMPVVIARAGIGKVLSAAGTAAMLNNYDISEVIFTGIAGGVSDDTRVLDVVIATALVQHDYGQITNDGFEWSEGYDGDGGYYRCDEGLVRSAYDAAVGVMGAGHVFKGVIATGDQFIASEEYVRRLQEDYNALACEMEGASVALVCEKYDVPCVVIRTMSDKADGVAHETYENMADMAADNSGRIIMEMMKAEAAKPSLVSEYWTEDSRAAASLNEYLLAVTDPASPDYIPVENRVAVFDLDGTLMCETCPFCFEYMVFADYALNHADDMPEEVLAVAREIEAAVGGAKPDGMSTRQAAAGAIAYKGMTMEELAKVVDGFKASDAWGFANLTRGEAYYRPMVELFNALIENDFRVYIVTATERNIVREVIRGTLDIPPSQVIGTEYGYTATHQGDAADMDYTFQTSDAIVFDGNYYGENAKTSKVEAIVREIGQQPVLAFGNSSGDLAMEIYTISDNPHKSAAFMVVADDEEREFGDAEAAGKKKASYQEQGIGIISMRDDFKTIYGEGVEKAEAPKG
ncbi:MAG: 5'-methylthioadenosine/adenosylhomocysteine nucleosidase [Clostridia bacterium]|nr:5'-methylthioadenosine/adenosylhomocysteine nucleosidase [Clostridia bacterium]